MYDSFRACQPGWDRISPLLDAFGVAGKRVLDLGCGTGSFFELVLSMRPASLDGYDVSESMIAQARSKSAVFSNPTHPAKDIPLSLVVGSTSLVADASYDVILCLQVLQNLSDDPENTGVARRLALLQEMHRLLAPGGLCIISTRYRKQSCDEKVSDGSGSDHSDCDSNASSSFRSTYGDLYWYADSTIVPKAVRFMEHATPADPADEMSQADFALCQLHNSPDTVIRRDAYYTGARVKDPSFRAADSFFSRVDPGEMEALLAHISQLEETGTLDDYIQRRDALRGGLGHVAVVSGRKAL